MGFARGPWLISRLVKRRKGRGSFLNTAKLVGKQITSNEYISLHNVFGDVYLDADSDMVAVDLRVRAGSGLNSPRITLELNSSDPPPIAADQTSNGVHSTTIIKLLRQ